MQLRVLQSSNGSFFKVVESGRYTTSYHHWCLGSDVEWHAVLSLIMILAVASCWLVNAMAVHAAALKGFVDGYQLSYEAQGISDFCYVSFAAYWHHADYKSPHRAIGYSCQLDGKGSSCYELGFTDHRLHVVACWCGRNDMGEGTPLVTTKIRRVGTRSNLCCLCKLHSQRWRDHRYSAAKVAARRLR